MTDLRSMSNEELLRLYGNEDLGAPRQPFKVGGLGDAKRDLNKLSDDELMDYYEQFGDPAGPFEDMAFSAPKAAYRGVTGIAAMPGLADAVVGGSVNLAAGAVGAPQHPRLFGPGGGVSNLLGDKIGERGILPTPSELEGQLNKDIPALGRLPEAQTPGGKVSSAAITGAVGGAAFGGGGLLRGMTEGAIAGGAGEAAGQGAEAIGLPPEASDALRLGTTLVTGGAGRLAPSRDRAPSRGRLAEDASRDFRAADSAGVQISQPAVADFVDRAIDVAVRGGQRDLPEASRMLTPTPMTEASLAMLNDASLHEMSLTELHRMRQAIGNAISKAEGNDRRIVMQIRDEFDDWVEGIDQTHIAPGHLVRNGQIVQPQEATAALQRGIRTWTRVRKSDTLADMEADARINANPKTGYSYEQALRQEYKKLAKSDRMRTFTREEQEAIRNAAGGGPLDRTAQVLSGLYPLSVRGAVSSMAVGGAGVYGGSPALAAIAPSLGLLGRGADKLLMRKKHAMADMLMRGGAGSVPTGPMMSGMPLATFYGNMATQGPPQ